MKSEGRLASLERRLGGRGKGIKSVSVRILFGDEPMPEAGPGEKLIVLRPWAGILKPGRAIAVMAEADVEAKLSVDVPEPEDLAMAELEAQAAALERERDQLQEKRSGKAG